MFQITQHGMVYQLRAGAAILAAGSLADMLTLARQLRTIPLSCPSNVVRLQPRTRSPSRSAA